MLTINNNTLADDNGVTNGDNGDMFGMTYLYDGSDPSLANDHPSYTGRISAVKWMYKYTPSGTTTTSTSNERSYVYRYDQLGQLISALYAERLPPPSSTSTTPFTANLDGFDEKSIIYDDDGNITALQRYAPTTNGTGGTAMDRLKYSYDPNNPDRLIQVADTVTATGEFGFNNTGNLQQLNNYQYDADGNLIQDPYKNISITYNMINKASIISVPGVSSSTICYTYGAAGAVLEKQVFNGASQTTTDYLDEFVYTNGVLGYFQMQEGRVVSSGGTFKPEYIITDQQGNARFSFQDSGSGSPLIIQENSYYGFGEVMPGSLVNPPPTAPPNAPNNNIYNGNSEWQNAFSNLPNYYQAGSRNYDPELGRFISVDPMAEMTESLTNYHYAMNNPIMGNDPSGNCDNDQSVGCELPGWVDPGVGDDFGGENEPVNVDTGGGGGNPGGDSSVNGITTGSTSVGGQYDNASTQDPTYTISYVDEDSGQTIMNQTVQGEGDDQQVSVALDEANSTSILLMYYRTGANDTGPSADVPGDDNSSNSANQGGNTSSTWDAINNGVDAFGVGWGAKGAMIDYAVLKSGSEASKALLTYGKVTDAVGVAGGLFAMGSASYNMYNQYEQHHKISDIHIGDVGDFTVGAANVGATIFLASNPIGWAIGAGAALYFTGRFIYQATHQETNQ